ncbi:MAG TPA: hypothetical protein VN276_02750, partial [Bacteroidales bacterium]|nr:hypothetical protein [Bacteroidales bacterium]
SVTDNDLYVNLFASNDADISFGKHKVMISQETNYPWGGDIMITVNPEKEGKFSLRLRIPGWARNEAIPGGLYTFAGNDEAKYIIRVNGKDYSATVTDGYASVLRKWKKGDKVELLLPMPVRTVTADNRVKDDNEKYAVQRGPLMFCAEWPDNPEGRVLNLVLDEQPELKAEFVPGLLNGTEVIRTKARQITVNPDGTNSRGEAEDITLIPYHLWNNRGKGEMKVWIPFDKSRK